MSSKKITVALAGAVWLAAAGSALAQPKSAASAPATGNTTTVKVDKADKGDEQAIKWFRMLDKNADGRLSRDETAWITRFKPSLAEEFSAADANRDGFVTQEEIRALANKRRVEREAKRKKEQASQGASTTRVSAP
ncbi:EF-hand domain-containing protein [Ottowia thiooxydans]|uniref:Ca2+-binding EF-hand superfamily protein n=1 Tax=Ottowia thiooxydans TaxID=219182 RepID=A0ABV2QEC0_9BURK